MQTRREFIVRSLGFGFALGHPMALFNPWVARASQRFKSPIAELPWGAPFASREFNGDEIDRPHELLWNKAEVLAKRGGLPPVTERHPLIIVGGGIAGLTAAYRLRAMSPLVLESASRFGGNAKAERVGMTDYSLGAAYLSAPSPGEENEGAAGLLKELGIFSDFRFEAGQDATVWRGGRLWPHFWSQGAEPAAGGTQNPYQRAYLELARIREEAFPAIPPVARPAEGELSRPDLDALDRLTFAQWLESSGLETPAPLREFFELYLWSSFAAESDQVSAAQALNFLCSDLYGTIAAPGGNARLASALYDKLDEALGANRMRTGAFVVDVRTEGSGVRVTWVDAAGAWRAASAPRCIVATPKVAARFVIEGLSDSQREAMEKIKSRAYLVCNLLLKKPVQAPGYELFRLESASGDGAMGSPLKEMQRRPCTDLTFGSWASQDPRSKKQADRSVLTLYRALPYEGARQFLFSPLAHDRERGYVEAGLPTLLAPLGLREDDIEGLRMTRWGHALPVAQAGAIASGQLERAHAPALEGRVLFCGQDNWANPSLETAVATAEALVSQLG